FEMSWPWALYCWHLVGPRFPSLTIFGRSLRAQEEHGRASQSQTFRSDLGKILILSFIELLQRFEQALRISVPSITHPSLINNNEPGKQDQKLDDCGYDKW